MFATQEARHGRRAEGTGGCKRRARRLAPISQTPVDDCRLDFSFCHSTDLSALSSPRSDPLGPPRIFLFVADRAGRRAIVRGRIVFEVGARAGKAGCRSLWFSQALVVLNIIYIVALMMNGRRSRVFGIAPPFRAHRGHPLLAGQRARVGRPGYARRQTRTRMMFQPR